MTTTRVRAEVKSGDVVQAGLLVANSEVGLGVVSVQPYSIRLVCMNGAVHNDFGTHRNQVGRLVTDTGEDSYKLFRAETLITDDRALFPTVRDVVGGAMSETLFRRIVGQVREANWPLSASVFSPLQMLLNKLSNQVALAVLIRVARDLPARQQTRRGTIEWSYDLLAEGEKQLFHRMAVFQGGSTVEDLEAVCNLDGKLKVDLLEGIEGLVSKSQMQQHEDDRGEPSFGMPGTIQEYARPLLK